MRRAVVVALALLWVGSVCAQEPPEQGAQRLEYRTLGGPRTPQDPPSGSQRPDFSATAPEGVLLPDAAGFEPRYARWETTLATSGFLWLVVLRSTDKGPYDRLYFDADCDGQLDDQPPLAGRARTNEVYEFGPVEIRPPGQDSPTVYQVNVLSVDYTFHKRIGISAACCWAGTVKLDGRDYTCVLADYSANGAFNDTSMTSSKADRICLERGDSRAFKYLGKYIEVDGRLYHPTVARTGETVSFALVENPPMGWLTVSKEMTRLSLAGENGQVDVVPKDGKAAVPVGKWIAASYLLRRTKDRFFFSDEVWTLTGQWFPPSSIVEVADGRATPLDVGEPVTATVATSEEESGRYFVEALKGRLGEQVSISRVDKQAPPPKLRIKNRDGSYDETFSFQYG